MDGGACGDAEGVIGNGPQDQSVCRDGKAWYLYYWQENDVVSTTAHQWGWTAAPPGSEQLGTGLNAGVTAQIYLTPYQSHTPFLLKLTKTGHHQLLPRLLQRRPLLLQRRHRLLPRPRRPHQRPGQPGLQRRLLGRRIHPPRLRCRMGGIFGYGTQAVYLARS